MKLMTAVKRLEKDFGMTDIDYRVKGWAKYQPVEFWVLTEKHWISVMPTSQVKTPKGYYLGRPEFDKHEVDYLATKRTAITIEVHSRVDREAEPTVFKISNNQDFDQILESLEG